MNWNKADETFIWIFPVGRGNAAFIRTGLNQGFILDMGKADDSDPAEFIKDHFLADLSPYSPPDCKASPIAQAILSHPHVDHIAQCAELGDDSVFRPMMLTLPHDKETNGEDERVNWNRIINPEGSEDLIESYRSLYKKREPPLQSIKYVSDRKIDNLEYGLYYVRPPICEDLHETDDNKYGNSISIMTYFSYGEHSILFPGDITPEGMDVILNENEGLEKRYTIFAEGETKDDWRIKTCDQPSLSSRLGNYGLSILVAPHHGLESCYSQTLFDSLLNGKPKLVIISERRHVHENDGKVDSHYQSEAGASGLEIEIDKKMKSRRSISTVNGHHILIKLTGYGDPEVFMNKDPEYLLGKIV